MAWNNSIDPTPNQVRRQQQCRAGKALSKQHHQQPTVVTAMPPSPTSSDDAHGAGSRRRQWQWARSADWDVHRARITELYRDRGLHLDQVIDIMAREHGFYASPRMYKTRISKWAIDKNYKAADVACMLLLKRQRAAQGKASSFVLRGRRVDWAKIEQYLKRDSTLLRRLEAGDDMLDLVPGHAQSSGILCRTPSPPPSPLPLPLPSSIPSSSAQLPSQHHHHYHHRPSVPTMSTTSMATTPTTASAAAVNGLLPSSSSSSSAWMPLAASSSSSSSSSSSAPPPSFHPHLNGLARRHSSFPVTSASTLAMPSLSFSTSSSSPTSSLPPSATLPLHRPRQQPPPSAGLPHFFQYPSASVPQPSSSSSSSSPSPSSSSPFSYRNHHQQHQHQHQNQHQQHHLPPASVPSSDIPAPASVPVHVPFSVSVIPGVSGVAGVPRVLDTPLELRLPEELARLTRDYCLAAFDKGLWVRDATATAANSSCCNYVSILGAQDGADRLRLWGQKMRLARHLIGSGHLDDGFRRVGLCTDELRQHVQEEDPALLFHLLGNTFGHTRNLRALAVTLCGHIRELTHIVLGAAHPLTRIFAHLATVVTSDAHFAVLPLPLQCMADIFLAQDASLSSLSVSQSPSRSPSRLPSRSHSVPNLAAASGAGSAAVSSSSFSSSSSLHNHPDNHPLCSRLSQLLLGSERPPRIAVPDGTATMAGVTTWLSSPPSSPVVKTEPLRQRLQHFQHHQHHQHHRHHSHHSAATAPSIVRYPIRGTLSVETQAELQSIVGALESSRNIHVRMRFYHVYLTCLSRLALAANNSSYAAATNAASGCSANGLGANTNGGAYPGLPGDSAVLSSSQVATATSAAIAAAAAGHIQASPSFSATDIISQDGSRNKNMSNSSSFDGNSACTASPASASMASDFSTGVHDRRANLATMRETQYFYILGVDVTQPEPATAPTPSTAGTGATPRTLLPVSSHDIMCGVEDASSRATEMAGALKERMDCDMTVKEPSMSRELEDLVNVEWVLP